MAHGSREPGRGPGAAVGRGWVEGAAAPGPGLAMSYEPLAINNRLIYELFNKYYPRIPTPNPASTTPLGDTSGRDPS